LTNLILERVFEPPITIADVYGFARTGGWCFDLYRVGWHGSLLAAGGQRLVCAFEAPDTESARTALRTTGADVRRLWMASVHESSPEATPNVIVERSFAEPIAFERAHALEEAKGWCLEQHRVQWARSYFSTDGRRSLCFYQAPDAESVRLAQHQAGLPFNAVWSFERAGPDTVP
jgi:hypothetical protein